MMYNHSSPSYKIPPPLGMVAILFSVFLLYVEENGTSGLAIYGTQARVYTAFAIVIFSYFSFHETHRRYLKAYRIYMCSFAFGVLMFLGCYFFSWWRFYPLMAIPLTMLWYPAYRWILKGLPLKEQTSASESKRQSKRSRQSDKRGQPQK